jgi:hypothetical protein
MTRSVRVCRWSGGLRSAISAALTAAVAVFTSEAAVQQTQPRPQRPVFRDAVDVVPLTVSVVDRSGVPVTGLTRADFTVRENGRPREILSFFPQVFGSGRIGSRSVAVGESGIFGQARFPDLQFAR